MAVATLPGQRKLIYHMSRVEGLTHEQTAQRLHLSKNTVKNQPVHALKSIRKRAGILSLAIIVVLTGR